MKFIEKIMNFYQLNKAIKIYGTYYTKCRNNIRSVLHYYTNKKNYSVAVWGAGLKGKAFLRVIDPKQQFIKCVYDIDKSKFNKSMPTGHKIVDYTMLQNQDVHVVLLMNNNFETEIASALEEQKMDVILINIDSIIAGELTMRSIISMHRKESNR